MIVHKDPKLEAILKVVDDYHNVMIRDTAIAVTDLENYLYYKPGNQLNHKVIVGSPIKVGSLVHEAIVTKQVCFSIEDGSKFGVPYVGKAVPIISHGLVCGSIFIGENTETIETIKDMSIEINDVVTTVNGTTQEINSQMYDLKSYSSNLIKYIHQMNEKIKGINEISKMIGRIGQQTQMLGINASIESARLGEAGRGFSVVASEIEKLSKGSKQSVAQIDLAVRAIDEEINVVMDSSKEVDHITQEIHQEVTMISEIIEHLNEKMTKLKVLSLTQ